jgi:hypothetical protein
MTLSLMTKTLIGAQKRFIFAIACLQKQPENLYTNNYKHEFCIFIAADLHNTAPALRLCNHSLTESPG